MVVCARCCRRLDLDVVVVVVVENPDREREGEIGGVAKKWIRIDNDFPRLFALLCLLTLKSS